MQPKFAIVGSRLQLPATASGRPAGQASLQHRHRIGPAPVRLGPVLHRQLGRRLPPLAVRALLHQPGPQGLRRTPQVRLHREDLEGPETADAAASGDDDTILIPILRNLYAKNHLASDL